MKTHLIPTLMIFACCGGKDPIDSGDPPVDSPPTDDTGPPELAPRYDLGSAHARVLGGRSFSGLGRRVALAGDVDGDGWEDLLVGSEDPVGEADMAGLVYLMRGPLDGDSSSDDAVASLGGPSDWDYSVGPFDLCRAGDMNADGYADIILGHRSNEDESMPSGSVYLQHGPVSGSLSVVDADAVLYGAPDSPSGQYSLAVADVNGDGIRDLWIGDSGYDEPSANAGAAYLFLGPIPARATTDQADATIRGVMLNEYAGHAVDAAGDTDGDGLNDLVVGAPSIQEGHALPGRVYLVLASAAETSSLDDAVGIYEGEVVDDRLGMSVASLDFDGDGYADLALGASGGDRAVSYAGGVYVVPGSTVGSFSVGDAARWIFVGVEEGEQAGIAVASGGDGDGDGCDDLLISASHFHDDRGRVYLARSPETGVSSLGLATARFLGEGAHNLVGEGHGSLAGGVDLSGDGVPDWVVGAFDADVESRDQGAVYVWSGAELL